MDLLDYDEVSNRLRVSVLRQRGVIVWSAERVYIGPEVAENAIEPGAVLMNAVIRGERTVIGRGAEIGEQGTASLTDVQIGRNVKLGPGSYRDCVLFHGARVRGFAELRAGTVLEECAELGHNVGFKNTFFGAWAVAGSCINFCDAYVNGGTSRLDHTEMGSGAMHFNFSPRRDKFGSLLGGSQGLLGREPPIFIGGNSGLVAPVEIPFGSLIPAGTTVRSWPDPAAAYSPSEQHRRKLSAAEAMLGALRATIAWYGRVRGPAAHVAGPDELEAALVREAVRQLTAHRDWRIAEVRRYVERVADRFGSAEGRLGPILFQDTAEEQGMPAAPERFYEEYVALRERQSHIEAVAALSPEAVRLARLWLMSIQAPG